MTGTATQTANFLTAGILSKNETRLLRVAVRNEIKTIESKIANTKARSKGESGTLRLIATYQAQLEEYKALIERLVY